MSTQVEAVDTSPYPILRQYNTHSDTADKMELRTRRRKQTRLVSPEADNDGAVVDGTKLESKYSDYSENIDGSRPMTRNKPDATKSAPYIKQQPKRRAAQARVAYGYKRSEDEMTGYFVRFLCDVLGRSLNLIKLPISIVLSLVILVTAFGFLSSLIKNQLCAVPGLNMLCWFSASHGNSSWKCSLPYSGRLFLECRLPATPHGTREVQRLLHAHEELNQVQEAIVGQISLPMFIKRTETAIREVSKRVELSDLPSKSVMVPLFTDFWKQARVLGGNIDKFFLHVGRTHDLAIGIMARTEQRLQHIQELDKQDRAQTFLSRAVSLLDPEPPSPFVLVKEEYLAHLERLKNNVDQLIVENKLVLESMTDLNDKLFVMGDYLANDNHELQGSQEQLTAGFFNKIKPKTPALLKIESSLATIEEVKSVRDYGVAVFDASLVRLQRMSAELDDLRERIVTEEIVVEEAKEIASLEFQILMVRKGLTRMQISKSKARDTREQYHNEMHEQLNEQFNTYIPLIYPDSKETTSTLTAPETFYCCRTERQSDGLSLISPSSSATSYKPEEFSLSKPSSDEIVERMFLKLLNKRGWNNLPDTHLEIMHSWSSEKKWRLVYQDLRIEWESKQKLRIVERTVCGDCVYDTNSAQE